MIEIRINKEIGNYEPKFVGPFTIRQAVCIAIAAPICIFIYHVFSPLITSELAGFLCCFPAAIAFFFGWRKPYGMPTEKFIRSIFITSIVAPANRKYKTENHHEVLLKEFAAHEAKMKKEEEEKAIEEQEEKKSFLGFKIKKKKMNKSQKKPRYQASSDAVL